MNNKTHTVISADKNGGLAFVETKYLTKCGVEEHLSNTAVYKKLSRGATYGQLQGVERLMESFISRHRDHLPDHEYTYLKRGLKRDRGRIGRFYTMVKLHKNKEGPIPHPFRPIVATCGTALAILSKWLDYKLQQLTPTILTYIKDTKYFLNYLKAFTKLQPGGRLPKNARMFKADATSMYTNIDTTHGLKILKSFLIELKEEGRLTDDFDIDMLIEAAALIMRWNLFEYGDSYFLQLLGTAMGTPVAVIWATIYFWWHENMC